MAQIARAYAVMGDISKAFRITEKIINDYDGPGLRGHPKAYALQAIAEASVRLEEKEKAAQLLSRALSLVEGIDGEEFKAKALQAIAEAYAKLGEKEKAAQLLSRALSLAEGIIGTEFKVTALKAIAEAYAKLGEKEKATQLLTQALSAAEEFGLEDRKAEVLRAIAETYAKLGKFRLSRTSAVTIPSEAEKAKTLALILEIWAKSKNQSLADEVWRPE